MLFPSTKVCSGTNGHYTTTTHGTFPGYERLYRKSSSSSSGSIYGATAAIDVVGRRAANTSNDGTTTKPLLLRAQLNTNNTNTAAVRSTQRQAEHRYRTLFSLCRSNKLTQSRGAAAAVVAVKETTPVLQPSVDKHPSIIN